MRDKNLLNSKTDYWTLRTKRLILEANRNGFDIRLGWIPGHADIPGNMQADTLANIGRILNVAKIMKIDVVEIGTSIRSNLKQQFKQKWTNLGLLKNYNYNKIQISFPFLDRRHVSTIMRMRTGHCLTGEHLHRIKIKESPLCECGEIDSLNHIFFECPINELKDLNLYKEFIKLKFSLSQLTRS